MPDLFYLLSKWWKQLLLIVALSMAVVTVVLYLQPTKYLAVTTAVPASTYATDKASIFNSNIQTLYPGLGSPEDLDMIIGTAQLDTVYIFISETFNLKDHYRTGEIGDLAIKEAASLLKTNTKVIKSDFGALKVKVWDKDNTMAARLANAITDKLQAIQQDMQSSNNIASLKSLQSGKERIQQQIDSISIFLQHSDITAARAEAYTTWRTILTEQLQQYEKLIGQYQLMVDNKSPALIIVERARPASLPDHPKKLVILIATFVLSCLFALALVLFLERRKAIHK